MSIAEDIVRRRIEDWRRRLIDLSYRNRLLSDSAIAQITDLEKSRVLRLRRKAARRSLMGD